MSVCKKNQKKLCLKDTCLICKERSFGYYDGLTKKGNRKVDCWDNEKNGNITPYEITKGSKKKYWFKCDICYHSFNSIIHSITGNISRWCPYCPNKKICDDEKCDFCFNNSFASYKGLTIKGNKKINCWDNEKNGDITPRKITKCSNSKYWFKCDICNHLFNSVIGSITNIKPNWCPYCPAQKLCNDEKCDFCFNNSFASYKGLTIKGIKKVDCWDNEKNSNITPRKITKGSNKKYWFKCDICNHSFNSIINTITGKNQYWCSYCSNKKLCNDNECNFCFNNSFASYNGLTRNRKLKVKCWNYEKNNNITPREITKCSKSKYWFKCDVCYHYFFSSLGNISCNRWCPYCCIPTKKLCNNNECDFCFNNSFASYKGLTVKGYKKVDCWDNEKNNITPRNIAKYSNSKYWFKCDICNHSFKSSISSITSKKPTWCPYCKNKTESKFKHWFNKQFPKLKLKYQPRYDWCRNSETGRYRPFDFVIEDTKTIIEIDGEQHFTQVSNWKDPDEQLQIDKFKMNIAIENGYSVIRILQKNIWLDKNQWEENFIKIYKQYVDPIIICVGCDKKYSKHI